VKSSDNQSVSASKVTGNKNLQEVVTPGNIPVVVPTRDNPNTIKEPSNNKQNNKLSDKRIESDSDLEEIVKAWPILPEHIRTTITTLVKTVRQ